MGGRRKRKKEAFANVNRDSGRARDRFLKKFGEERLATRPTVHRE